MKKSVSKEKDVIVGISTGLGRGAISIVRISGSGAHEVTKKLFTPFPKKANNLVFGKVLLNGFCDNAMCVWFAAPKSYTGENMAEIHIHGGSMLAKEVLEKLMLLGCRLAEKGEYTKRAFINGKTGLTSAEGIMDIIDSESKIEAINGSKLLAGKLEEKIYEIQSKLTEVIAEIEAALDYPEEEIDVSSHPQIKEKLKNATEELKLLMESAKKSKLIKNGLETAIVGNTNVGKSSLLNALTGVDRAIVTEIAGTTRDTIEQSINYKDIKISFIDTAGIRKTENLIESLGVKRSRDAVKKADVVLLVYDANSKNFSEYEEIRKEARTIVVFNKSDLNKKFEKPFDGIVVSAKTGEKIEDLKEAIYTKAKMEEIEIFPIILTNERHIGAVFRTIDFLSCACNQLDHTTLDCVCVDIRNAWLALGEITGKNVTEEVISKIFDKFCLGK